MVDAEADGETGEPRSILVLPAELVMENSPLKMLADGDSVELIRPPQGGHIVLVSAKVRNVPTDSAVLRVRVRRPGGLIVAEEGRTVSMVDVPGEPGFKQPNLGSWSQAANVPLCPDYDATDILDQELMAEVRVSINDGQGNIEGVGYTKIVPRCSQRDAADLALCRCECTADYELGRCGADDPLDASASDAGMVDR